MEVSGVRNGSGGRVWTFASDLPELMVVERSSECTMIRERW